MDSFGSDVKLSGREFVPPPCEFVTMASDWSVSRSTKDKHDCDRTRFGLDMDYFILEPIT